MLNVKIFGNSITNTRHDVDVLFPTFTETVLNHYNCYDFNDVCRGVARCSEERILFNLKKTKKIDVAVIFHGILHHEFCVSCIDDFADGTIDDDDLTYMLDNNLTRGFYENVQKVLPKSKSEASLHLDPRVVKQQLDDRNRLYYHRDLQRNRYYGALIQIDQYLTFKQIKAVHITSRTIPAWFKFSSGIVNTEFGQYQYHPVYGCSYSKSVNAVTEDGNKLIADTLISYIDSMINH